ncbi:putative G-protein coupled receptor 21-like Protein [Tribolium castaneum]|uniref:Putative G-protein coupled receptor 21-like Protein n=2 Tax=Tribolium castaneum TaxID=7070 RepID=D6WGI4_TRICA|nr:putative G-protein coupled receptor 21-like Protein [Tribolium castaneum]
MEMMKLSGILVTVTHLLALSLNHYIGILKPLHYNSIVTRRKVTAVTILLWLFPTAFVIFLFTSQAEGAYWRDIFSNETEIDMENQTTFVDTFRFRMSYSAYFIVSIFLMAICYTHILIIVKKQQNIWKNLSRVGSTKWSGRSVKHCPNKANKEQKQLEGNIRAIYTTLLILGSCVIGWMPALLIFVLMCKEDCYIHGAQLRSLNENYLIEVMSMRLLENMLIVLKMLANPIIYSIRMKEIQEGTKHMQATLLKVFCPSRPDSNNYTLASRRSPNAYNCSLRTRLTTASINNGGHTSHVSIGRTELVNTLL